MGAITSTPVGGRERGGDHREIESWWKGVTEELRDKRMEGGSNGDTERWRTGDIVRN